MVQLICIWLTRPAALGNDGKKLMKKLKQKGSKYSKLEKPLDKPLVVAMIAWYSVFELDLKNTLFGSVDLVVREQTPAARGCRLPCSAIPCGHGRWLTDCRNYGSIRGPKACYTSQNHSRRPPQRMASTWMVMRRAIRIACAPSEEPAQPAAVSSACTTATKSSWSTAPAGVWAFIGTAAAARRLARFLQVGPQYLACGVVPRTAAGRLRICAFSASWPKVVLSKGVPLATGRSDSPERPAEVRSVEKS
jgi:hypothetical protein